MIHISDVFAPYPTDLLILLREYEDNWRLTIPDDAINPLPWLQRYATATTLPTYPSPDSSLCLVVVLVAQTLDGSDLHLLAALVPTAEAYQRLVLQLVEIYELALVNGSARMPLVGVFFTIPKSVIAERDPELFEV